MQILRRETVQEVKEHYPLLKSIANKVPYFFSPGNVQVSITYRVARLVAQIFIGLASSLVALNALQSSPTLFISALYVGIGFGVAAYAIQAIIRRSIKYEGSWPMIYIQGCSLLQKKWRVVEATVIGGGILTAYTVSSEIVKKFPTWMPRQSGVGVGVWIGYMGSDVVFDLFNKIIK